MSASSPAEIMTGTLFRFSTAATPRQVWDALTLPALTERYLHGLRLQGTWGPGSVLVVDGPGQASLQGEVLAAESPIRLSYALSSGDGQPWTYLTWEIRSVGTGAVVRLHVDEPDGAFPAPEDVEDAWLSVIAELESLLRQGVIDAAVGTVHPSLRDLMREREG